MNQHYQSTIVAWAVMLCLIFSPIFQLHAQSAPAIQQKVFRVKFKENFVQRLERSTPSRAAEGHVQTGLSSLDQLSRRWGVSSIKRVFPQAGKFEEKHRRYGLHLWYEVELADGAKTLNAIASFAQLADVLMAEPVYEKYSGMETFAGRQGGIPPLGSLPNRPNDPLLNSQWHYNNTGQGGGTPGADIRLLEAWQMESGNPSVIVAVIDGGIDVNHHDLAANMWINTGEIPGNGIDDDGNGYVDDIYGYNFGDNNSNIPANNHGTHVGGTVAAVTNNSVGVAGVAGGSGNGDGVRLMSLSAFGAYGVGGFDQAFIYAADNGAVISQNSWGYTAPNVYEQSILDAIDYFIAEAGYDAYGNPTGPMQGGIVIFAAGNSGSDGAWYPAYYEPVFAVAATDRYDRAASFSNYGSWVELAAPGVAVYSTLPNNSYGTNSGTSMACPHVSGVAALIVSQFAGNITPQQVWERLVSSADPISSLPAGFGSGRLNAAAALQGSQENDGIAPDAVMDLQLMEAYTTALKLGWTAPADSGNGNASYYNMRYATEPITEANFHLANPVSGLPAAAAAGTWQSFSISGLQPSTTYYIALKSVDLFGNISAISNIASGTTQSAPLISVNPAYLEVEIDASLFANRILTIANEGEGAALEFNLYSDNQGYMVDFSPATGSIMAGESIDINLTFNAYNSPNGYYYVDLQIFSNDPLTPTFYMPCSVVVNGQRPTIVVDEDRLAFDTVYVGGRRSLPLVIRNLGMDHLMIHDIISSDTAFTPGTRDLFLYPNEEAVVYVTYAPTETGPAQAMLSIFSNDYNQPMVAVFLEGTSMLPPIMEVSPGQLNARLNRGETASEMLTLSNTGQAPLTFSFPAFAVQNLLNNPALEQNNTSPVAVPAHYKDKAKNSQEADPAGHPVVLGAGADLGFGYSWIDSDMAGGPAYLWEDIAATGTEILRGVDDGFEEIVLPFTFDFYGELKNKVKISSNGFLTFGRDARSFSNSPIPGYGGPHDFIAPFWDDLVIYDQARVFYTSSQDALIVQYEKVGRYGGQGYATFQVKLLANGAIFFYYKQMSTLEILNSATIGLENANETDGLQIAFNTNYVKDNLAVMIIPPSAGFITGVSYPSGSLPANSSLEIAVSLSAGEREAGVYQQNLLINSNDPMKPVHTLAVSLEIKGDPKIAVMADSMDFGMVYVLDQPAPSTNYLPVKNIGAEALTLSAIYVLDSTVFSVDFAGPQVLGPQEERLIPVHFSPASAGNFSSQLVIESNDPADSIITVGLWGQGVYPPIFQASAPSDVVFARLRSNEIKNGSIQVQNSGGSLAHYNAYVIHEGDSGFHAMATATPMQNTVNWIRLEPVAGSLSPGESSTLNLHMNASLVAGGDYQAGIYFYSNDPVNPQIHIPLQLHVNSLPEFDPHATAYSIDENTELQLALSATDADGGLLVYRLLESYPNVSFQSTTAGASFRFLPSYEQSGFYSFTVEVEDDMQEITRTSFRVEVRDVNRAPVVVSQIKNQSVKVGAQLSLNLASHFQDPDNDKLLFSASTSTPSLLSLSVNENVLTITGLSAGTAIVSLVTSDGKGGTAGTSFEIKVSGGKKEGGNGKRELEAEAEELIILSRISNYPNPFSGQTTIAYSLEESVYVRLQVFTPLGVSVIVLADGIQDAGNHTIEFDAGKLPAGLYLYKLQIGERIVTKRMIAR